MCGEQQETDGTGCNIVDIETYSDLYSLVILIMLLILNYLSNGFNPDYVWCWEQGKAENSKFVGGEQETV